MDREVPGAEQILTRRSFQGFPGGSAVKNLPAMQEAWDQSLCWEDRLEKEMASHSSILEIGRAHV